MKVKRELYSSDLTIYCSLNQSNVPSFTFQVRNEILDFTQKFNFLLQTQIPETCTMRPGDVFALGNRVYGHPYTNLEMTRFIATELFLNTVLFPLRESRHELDFSIDNSHKNFTVEDLVIQNKIKDHVDAFYAIISNSLGITTAEMPRIPKFDGFTSKGITTKDYPQKIVDVANEIMFKAEFIPMDFVDDYVTAGKLYGSEPYYLGNTKKQPEIFVDSSKDFFKS